jgi:hypothetical protein
MPEREVDFAKAIALRIKLTSTCVVHGDMWFAAVSMRNALGLRIQAVGSPSVWLPIEYVLLLPETRRIVVDLRWHGKWNCRAKPGGAPAIAAPDDRPINPNRESLQ